MKRKLAVFGVLFAVAALAVGDKLLDKIDSVQWFRSRVYIGSAVVNPPQERGNALSMSLATHVDYNFPELSSVALGIACADSFAADAGGAVVGDSCIASSDTALPAESTLRCEVTAASTVKFRMCAFLTDGGSNNAADAGYNARLFR